MALATAKSSPDPAPPSLAERLAESQRAELTPRKRVAELEAALQAAIDAKDYATADKAQADLQPAREALAIATGTTRGLAEALTAIEAQRAAEQRAIAAARQQEEAQKIIGEAIVAEKRALDSIQESLAQMRACLGAAQDAFRQAQQWEFKGGQERRRIVDARVALGELEMAPRHVHAPNHASVLAEGDPLIRALVAWNGN